MTPSDVWIKKIGRHRGRPRLFLDGLQAIRAGFAPGERFDVEIDGKRVILSRNQDGSRVVSSRKKGQEQIPVVDINSAELLSVFEGMDAIRVVVARDRVFLLPLASQAKKVERVQRLQGKLAAGEALSAGSVAHGGGVLAHAVHTGLRDAGIECTLEFANELRDDLLEQAIAHNDIWNDETAALALPMALALALRSACSRSVSIWSALRSASRAAKVSASKAKPRRASAAPTAARSERNSLGSSTVMTSYRYEAKLLRHE